MTEPHPGPAADPAPPAGLARDDLAEPPTTPTVPVLGRGRPDRPGLGWTEIAVGAVVYLVVNIALGLLLVLVSGGLPSAPVLLVLSAICAFVAAGVALVVRVRSLAAIGLRRTTLRRVAIGVASGLVAWVVARGLIIAYVAITGDVSDPQASLTDFSGAGAAVAVLVLGGLVVPLGEELLFRGVLFGALYRYGVVLAAVVSGLVFGLAHGLNVVLPAAFLLGVVNALLYHRSRSIWPAAAAHATFNLLSFGLLLVLGS